MNNYSFALLLAAIASSSTKAGIWVHVEPEIQDFVYHDPVFDKITFIKTYAGQSSLPALPTMEMKDEDAGVIVRITMPGLDKKAMKATIKEHEKRKESFIEICASSTDANCKIMISKDSMRLVMSKGIEQREESDTKQIYQSSYSSNATTKKLPHSVVIDETKIAYDADVLTITLKKEAKAEEKISEKEIEIL